MVCFLSPGHPLRKHGGLIGEEEHTTQGTNPQLCDGQPLGEAEMAFGASSSGAGARG